MHGKDITTTHFQFSQDTPIIEWTWLRRPSSIASDVAEAALSSAQHLLVTGLGAFATPSEGRRVDTTATVRRRQDVEGEL